MPNAKPRKKAKNASRRAQRFAVTFCALALVVVLLTGMSFGWFRDLNALSVAPSDRSDEGMVRVSLRSLGRPAALGMTLDGAYTVDGDAGFRFARGTEIAVAEDNGNLLLSAGGMTVNMGGSFTLTRHAPSDGNAVNGIYIHESEKDTLFCGDLKLVSSEGGIDAVLTIQVEEYLYGVVAYEMSDSFPLEALKAQAVAARTYAMRAKDGASKRDYDVTDTTADQVFKGFDAANKRVIRAVDETRGIVGMSGGAFAGCYYTASNGGQIASTEQIWGGKTSYIVMKDDPYDLENPLSQTKKAFVSRKPDADSAISGALAASIAESMAAMGLSDEVSDIRIDEILSVEPVNPDREGSRMYREMEFTVMASGRRFTEILPEPEASPEEVSPEASSGEAANAESDGALWDWADAPAPTDAPAMSVWDFLAELMTDSAPEKIPDEEIPDEEISDEEISAEEAAPDAPRFELSDFEAVSEPFTVRLPTYGLLKELLNLNINSSSFEVFEAEESADGFTLVSRRYGHGIGMSQRGAQVMADRYGMSCEEILNFYYPGMELVQIDWQEKPLSNLETLSSNLGRARPRPTPRPTQAPLRSLTGKEYYASVTLATSSSSLNVREQPNTSSRVVGTLLNGNRVIVVSAAADGWYQIQTTELSGYVKGDYISPSTMPAP